ncbi:MAG TPA: sigma-70 family RNA polymerase sigma factor [Phycisphaerales bacterium]|nr:sigma-70 family RNA polymerase sigma factor [Phycisphaerales bacterium]HRQ76003.1 sigma-70 family RNA polymerase sigma factor [Phycisphaerales bacterium]
MIRTMIGDNSPLDRLRQRQRVVARDENGTTKRPVGRKARRRPGLSSDEERTLRAILSEPMDYIDSEEFRRPGAEARIYDEAPEVEKPDVSWYRPLMDDPSTKYTTTKRPGTLLLTAAEERVLFLQYNYARHRVSELQNEVGLGEPTEEQAREILHWYRIAQQYREQIAETNLALVLAMAKRTRMSEVDFADLVSEGNMALLRSVDKFDCGRGFKFSTYACRAILKAFSRQGMKLSKYRQRFPTDFDPALEKSNHLETLRRTHEEECAEEIRHIVENNDADLSDVEQTVIHHRFGLNAKENAIPLTLEQVGQIIGVTKERVRQIQNKALEKIRAVLEESATDSVQQVLNENSGKPSSN